MSTRHALRSPLLDAVRGVAIGQVFVWHIFTPILKNHIPLLGTALGLSWTGVDLFFVLSGYLLGGILLKNRTARDYFKTFYARRFLRILPLYAITLVLFSILYPVSGPWWSYLTFTQNLVWARAGQWGHSFIIVTWSLAVEEQFYLFLPLIIRFSPPRLLPAVVIGLICSAPVFRGVAILGGYPYAAYMLMPCRMDALFLGVLMAWTFQTDWALAAIRRRVEILWVGTAILAAGFAALVCSRIDVLDWRMAQFGYTETALFYSGCLMLLLIKPRPLSKILAPLTWAGQGAYSIYLFHIPIMLAVYRMFGVGFLTLFLICVGNIAVAAVCWFYIERPCIDLGHRRFRYGGKPAST